MAGIAVCATGHSHPDGREGDQTQAAEVHAHLLRLLARKQIGSARRSRRSRRSADRDELLLPVRHRGRRSRDQTRALRQRARRASSAFSAASTAARWARCRSRPASTRSRKASSRPCPASRMCRIRIRIARCSRATIRARQCSTTSRTSCSRRNLPPSEVAAILVEPIQGEGGYLVPPRRLPAGPARAVRPARHPADLRRGAVGHRPHRQDVRVRALRRRARHHDARQGPRLGPADRHDGREARH